MSELDQQFMMNSEEMAADRMIAMNPSGMVEMYQNQPEMQEGGEECPDGVCPMEDGEEECPDGVCPMEGMMSPPTTTSSSSPAPVATTSWTTYLMYLVILLVILAAAYFGYKYFMCKE
jgi:hypothetical protein